MTDYRDHTRNSLIVLQKDDASSPPSSIFHCGSCGHQWSSVKIVARNFSSNFWAVVTRYRCHFERTVFHAADGFSTIIAIIAGTNVGVHCGAIIHGCIMVLGLYVLRLRVIRLTIPKLTVWFLIHILIFLLRRFCIWWSFLELHTWNVLYF